MSHSGKPHGPLYVKVWIGLLILTVITVGTSYMDFGTFNILIAMLIATVKASLVVLFFMHLYDDSRLNQVVFASSIFFLIVFVGLTGSDLFFRTDPVPGPVVSEFGGAIDVPADVIAMRTPTPELIAAGQAVYAAQCATCHGKAGQGDGAAANPPPRNFTASDGWRFGRAPLEMFHTVTDGSPNTAMAAYQSALSVKDRWAVVHFIRSNFMQGAPDDTAAAVAKLTSGEGLTIPAPRIPVAMALAKLAVPDAVATTLELGAVQGTSQGAALYAQYCASCHGATGAGGKKVAKLGVAPYAYQFVAPLRQDTTGWIASKDAFVHVVSAGLPGKTKPALAHFTADEWDALYDFVKALK